VGIKEGDVLIIDRLDRQGNPLVDAQGNSLQENVRVGKIGEVPGLQPGEIPLLPIRTAPSPAIAALQKHKPGDTIQSIELTTMGDRIPGKININTIWDRETFYALAAATRSHNYDIGSNPSNGPDVSVDTNVIYQQMMGLRSPQGQPSLNDQPFLGMAAPYYDSSPGGVNLNRTLLAATKTDPKKQLMQVPYQADPYTNHPYVANQLLNRIFNNVTTRSNVFAVWVTVGFFEVIDDTVRPVKLGAEIGKAENRHIRHRLFSIVDRSALAVSSQIGTLQGSIPTLDPQGVPLSSVTNQIVIGPSPPIGLIAPIPTKPSDPPPGRTKPQSIYWTIRPGDVVVVGHGLPNQETVRVTSVTGNKITANFTLPHFPGEMVSVGIVPGNPGPLGRFNPRDALYQEVVPYLSIIQ
jgi:hypothetical protein